MVSDRLFCVLLVSVFLVMHSSAQVENIRPAPVRRLPCPSFDYDAFYDFQTNTNTTSPYVSVHTSFVGTGCRTRGVFKIALSAGSERKRVIVDMFLEGPQGWVANIGDSATNNGYAGDAGTQTHDAEVQVTDNSFTGYYSDAGGSGQAFHYPNLVYDRLTVNLGDSLTVFQSGSNFGYFDKTGMFALNGQPDSTGPVNYDIFVATNRVISGPGDRTGKGLCKIGFKFLANV